MTPASPQSTARLITALREDVGRKFSRLTLDVTRLADQVDVSAADGWTMVEERSDCMRALDRANADARDVETIVRRITAAVVVIAYNERARTPGAVHANP